MNDNLAISPGDLERAYHLLGQVETAYGERIVGQIGLRTALLTALLSGGHVLLESVPGLAKTTAAQTLASSVGGTFHRIQCTPDLMPADIVGTQVLAYETGELTTQLGPVHANMVLLDEINRASAKTQSAMLEAMAERQTSIGGKVHPLPNPFMVLATQNPIEQEGVYVLPEAQLDRFMIKEVMTYPSPSEEVEVLERVAAGVTNPGHELATPAITLDDVRFLQRLAGSVFVHRSIKEYIVALVGATRSNDQVPGLTASVQLGASPRGGIALLKLASALALMEGRTHVVPDDVKAMRYGALRHRLVLTYDALANEVTPESIIDSVFAAVPVP